MYIISYDILTLYDATQQQIRECIRKIFPSDDYGENMLMSVYINVKHKVIIIKFDIK